MAYFVMAQIGSQDGRIIYGQVSKHRLLVVAGLRAIRATRHGPPRYVFDESHNDITELAMRTADDADLPNARSNSTWRTDRQRHPSAR